MRASQAFKDATLEDIHLCTKILKKAEYDEKKKKYIIKKAAYQEYMLNEIQFSLLYHMAARINDTKSLKTATGIESEGHIKSIEIVVEGSPNSRKRYPGIQELFDKYNSLANLTDKSSIEERERIRNQILEAHYKLIESVIDRNFKSLSVIPNLPPKEIIYIIGYEVVLEYLEKSKQINQDSLRTFIYQRMVEMIIRSSELQQESEISLNEILDMKDPESEEKLFQSSLDRREIILKVLDTLESKDAIPIIMYLYGFTDGKEHNDSDGAKYFGITSERVSQKREKFLCQLGLFVRSEVLEDLMLGEAKRGKKHGGRRDEHLIIERKLLRSIPQRDFENYIHELEPQEKNMLNAYYRNEGMDISIEAAIHTLGLEPDEMNTYKFKGIREKLRYQIKKQINAESPDEVSFQEYLRFLMNSYVYSPKTKR